MLWRNHILDAIVKIGHAAICTCKNNTGPLCEEFTDLWKIPLTKCQAEIRYLSVASINQVVGRLVMLPVSWDAMALKSLHYNGRPYFSLALTAQIIIFVVCNYCNHKVREN